MKPLNGNGFNKNLEETVLETIDHYNLLEDGEKIAIALSGGKDSVLVLYLLARFRDIWDLDLVAITVDEGISNYRDAGLVLAREHTTRLGVELVETSFKEAFNFSLDEVHHLYPSACMPCGVFRRHLLNKTARELGVSKIATGHNLDDEIQSFLMSFARADLRKFSKFGPKLSQIHPKLIPRIKPLWMIPEKEVGVWTVINQVKVHREDCPYASQSIRFRLKNYLNWVEEKKPGTKKAILESFKKSLTVKTDHLELLECLRCGEPSALDMCKACEMQLEIKKLLED